MNPLTDDALEAERQEEREKEEAEKQKAKDEVRSPLIHPFWFPLANYPPPLCSKRWVNGTATLILQLQQCRSQE